MKEIMTRIELSGSLGRIFGRFHSRSISKVSEATRALAATLPNFEQYMKSSKKRGITYAIFKDKKNIAEEDLGFPVNGEIIRIVPVVIGSKKAGILQTVLGAVLVAVGAVMIVLSGGTASPLAAGLLASGVAMAAGGVIQLLSPQASGLASKQDSANQASYAFGGVTNTASQGYPVPLGYGRRRVGGAIISAGIYVEDQQ